MSTDTRKLSKLRTTSMISDKDVSLNQGSQYIQTTSTKFAGNIPSLPSTFPVHLQNIPSAYLDAQNDLKNVPIVNLVSFLRDCYHLPLLEG